MSGPRSFHTYVHSLIQTPLPDLGRRLIDSLVWCRDHLNGGEWGQLARATLLSGDVAFHGVSFGDRQLDWLAEQIDRGKIRTLAVDLDYLAFTYTRVAADYQTTELMFHTLYSEDGTSRFVERFAAVFAPESTLVADRLTGLGALYGFVEVVPTDGDPSPAFASWSGHYRDFLGPKFLAAVGGVAALRAALPDHIVSLDTGGSAWLQIPVGPLAASAPAAEAARAALTRLLVANLPDRLSDL